MDYRLNHEKLDVYVASIEFLAFSVRIIEVLPRGRGNLVDQLRRASTSIPLNIAEGAGKRFPDDRRRFYDIARGSAHECGAVVDVCRVLGFMDEAMFSESKKLLHRIVSMLVKLK